MSESGVEIQISAEDDFSSAFDDLISESSQASENLGGLANIEEDVASTSSEAASNTDEFAQALQNANENAEQSATAVAESNESVQATSSSFSSSIAPIAGTAGAIGSVTTSSFALNDAYTQLDNSTLSLTNAHDNLAKAQNNVANAALSVQTAQNSLSNANLAVSNAQQKLNILVAEGITSGPEYTEGQNALTEAQNSAANAQDSLTKAQTSAQNSSDALTNAQDKLQMAQNNTAMANQRVEEQWISMGTSTIPLLLTNLGNFQKVIGMVSGGLDSESIAQEENIAATGEATEATSIWDAVLDANPIMLVVIAIAALVAIIGVVTDGFKNWTPLIDAAKASLNFFWDLVKGLVTDLETLYDDITKVGNVMGGIGKGISSVGSDLGSALHLASGGRVTSPTLAVIGEGGEPENVIPDSQMGGLGNGQITVHQYNTINRNADAKFANMDLLNRLAANLRTGY